MLPAGFVLNSDYLTVVAAALTIRVVAIHINPSSTKKCPRTTLCIDRFPCLYKYDYFSVRERNEQFYYFFILALLLVYYPIVTILAPNGINANFACLKHCNPNGIPIIVMQRSTPLSAANPAIGKPPKIIQRIFKRNDPAPPS